MELDEVLAFTDLGGRILSTDLQLDRLRALLLSFLRDSGELARVAAFLLVALLLRVVELDGAKRSLQDILEACRVVFTFLHTLYCIIC